MKYCSRCKMLKDDSCFWKEQTKCKECKKILRRLNHLENKERDKRLASVWKRKYPEKVREFQRRYHHKVKITILKYYGGNPPKCACCGEAHIEFLVIDHTEGGGNKQRQVLGHEGLGTRFYMWLRKNGYPKGYRVLCDNCNMSRGRYGYCPHEKE